MGFWDGVLGRSTIDLLTPKVTTLGLHDVESLVLGLSPAEMYRSQSQVRTVVGFIARNVANLRLHVYERVSDTDRRRDHESALARALVSPRPGQTQFELLYSLAGDITLYDRAFVHVVPGRDGGAPMLRRLPPSWVGVHRDMEFDEATYTVSISDKSTRVPAAEMLEWPGYRPDLVNGDSPAIWALKSILVEQINAADHRGKVWRKGGQISGVLRRPMDAPDWSDDAVKRFKNDWERYSADGPDAGGTPVLQDGMSYEQFGFSAKDNEYVEGSKLALTTVAAAFYVNPTMVGLLDNSNYSNMREFRKALYGECLGPLLRRIEDRVNGVLIPQLGMDPSTHYAEFNVRKMLQSSFEEEAAVLQTSAGGPWMTRNEARARQNLPALDGGDELIVPLNVVEGGQASPTDSGSQNRNEGQPSGVKADLVAEPRPVGEPDELEAQHVNVLRKFLERQGVAVLSRAAAGSDWWSKDRWDRELTDELVALHALAATSAGRDALAKLGIDPDRYDSPRTDAFLREAAERSAVSINETTHGQYKAALDDGGSDAVKTIVAAGFAARAAELGSSTLTFARGFGATEAARQVGGSKATKTWVTTSGNPRSSHARLHGVTVGIDEEFPNGLKWPGQAGGPADEIAGCKCRIEVNIPTEGQA